jgi:hypothetical protein
MNDDELEEAIKVLAKYTLEKTEWKVYANFEASKGVGYGPFVAPRSRLNDHVVRKANPTHSVHISGCRGAGKSLALREIGKAFQSKGARVYYFQNSTLFNREKIADAVETLVARKVEAVLLVDETQNNTTSATLTEVIRNPTGHMITTIGAGVPAFTSLSSQFSEAITTDRLFISSEQMMVDEGIVGWFVRGIADVAQHAEAVKLLEEIRSYVGGHIYPLMWSAEKLIPLVARANPFTANQAMEYYESQNFRSTDEFKNMTNRILPGGSVRVETFRSLLTLNPDPLALKELRRQGFCDEDNKLISVLLFDAFMRSVTIENQPNQSEKRGLMGVEHALKIVLPQLSWSQYDAIGGPTEDAMTFELLLGISRFSSISTRIFGAKLVNSALAARKPDVFLNSHVNSYVECVLTTGNNDTERKKLDEHISRFYWQGYSDDSKRQGPPYYPVGGSEFAILNYQKTGDVPIQPFLSCFAISEIFEKRVFTFLMASKHVYVGNICIV